MQSDLSPKPPLDRKRGYIGPLRQRGGVGNLCVVVFALYAFTCRVFLIERCLLNKREGPKHTYERCLLNEREGSKHTYALRYTSENKARG